jgi:hypothetical protein
MAKMIGGFHEDVAVVAPDGRCETHGGVGFGRRFGCRYYLGGTVPRDAGTPAKGRKLR